MSGSSIAAAIPLQTLIVLLVAITLAWAVMSVVVMRRHRRHREVAVLQARPRRRERLATEEAGTFVPLASVFDDESEPAPEPEPEPEPEPDPEPDGVEPAPHPSALAPARTYEIVWYREEERIAFALQPVDGRAAAWARYRSSSFAWAEDRDPPASLRAAQRAHGRLRARLERDDWVPGGRGEGWYRHRFEPPVNAPDRDPDEDDGHEEA